MHALPLLIADASSTSPNNLVGIVVGSISILASIAYVVRMLTRMESKLDTHNERAEKHEKRLDKHDDRLADHNERLRLLEAEPTERLKVVRS